MENIRIAVLSAYDTTLAFLDNQAPESMHYYSDELHIYMEGAASTYTFCTNAKHPESTHLVEGNKLAFRYRHKDYYFNIMRVSRDEYEVEVEAYSLVFELLNEEKGPYKAAESMSFAEYLTAFNYEQTVNLGINEVSDKKIKHEWTGTETLLARLYSLANVFSAEVEFVPKLNEDYSLKNIKMNVYIEHSDKDQGIGSDRTDIVLRYGKNVSGITKTSDITELYTAIRPTGKDGLTVMALDKKELDANGDVEYISPKNNGNIYAVQAKDRFPSNLMANENERYIAKIWEYDTDNVNTLYGQALAQLKKNCVPQVQYEVEGYFDTDIGDTVTIADEEYNPPLYLQARVTEQSRSFTDPTQNKTTFDNFKELKSQIDPSLMNAVKQMMAANKTYTCSILTDNGIVFKNGEGSTTLTASVMDVGEDMAGSLTIKWYKDGAAAGIGVSLLVKAADISGKAVYRYEALEGTKVRGTCEVTVSNVTDGAEGTGYTVLLSNESYSFATGTSAAVAGSTFTNVNAYKNTAQVQATITKIGSTAVSGNATSIATGFTGLTAAVTGNGTTTCKITFSATTALTAKNGSISITISVDGKTFTKEFSFSLSLKGDTGGKGETGIIVSATAPTNPTVGQLWQTATKQPIKRWDGSAWVVHYISVDNLDVENLSAITSDLGTVTAGSIDIAWEEGIGGGSKYVGHTKLSKSQAGSNPLLLTYDVVSNNTGNTNGSGYAQYGHELVRIGYADTGMNESWAALRRGDLQFFDGNSIYLLDPEKIAKIDDIINGLEYKTYTATNVNSNIGNKSIIIKANAYDCKINGFMYLNPATYNNDTILFKTPLRPSATIYFSTTVAGRGFKVLTDGSVRANGIYTVSAAAYVYFGVSFAINQDAG